MTIKKALASAGFNKGNTIKRKLCQRFAPSMTAASSNFGERFFNAPSNNIKAIGVSAKVWEIRIPLKP